MEKIKIKQKTLNSLYLVTIIALIVIGQLFGAPPGESESTFFKFLLLVISYTLSLLVCVATIKYVLSFFEVVKD